ncbi:MAG: DNA replication and repair protein RecF [candidate division WWE3 bacterium]|nr:DNA replication and repair protein RecF [candidate division WWE3 bacterium]
MELKSLELRNFRSYSKAKFSFDPKTTLIVGPNGSGKTNILEALGMLSAGRTFRGRFDREVIRHGKTYADVFGVTSDNELSVVVQERGDNQYSSQKLYKVNNVPKHISGFVGNLRSVIFRPEDIDLLVDGPAVRRRYLDDALSQVDGAYSKSLSNYGKIVTRRNHLLADDTRSSTQLLQELEYWNQELLSFGTVIQEKRQAFIAELNHDLPQVVNDLLGGLLTDLQINYLPNRLNKERLLSHEAAELASHITLIGPHRDDWKLLESDYDLSLFGSRGQQRTGVLALKLFELDYISMKVGERPLLLLDDVFSELDDVHQEAVLATIGKQQTILTATHVPEFRELKYCQRIHTT